MCDRAAWDVYRALHGVRTRHPTCGSVPSCTCMCAGCFMLPYDACSHCPFLNACILTGSLREYGVRCGEPSARRCLVRRRRSGVDLADPNVPLVGRRSARIGADSKVRPTPLRPGRHWHIALGPRSRSGERWRDATMVNHGHPFCCHVRNCAPASAARWIST